LRWDDCVKRHLEESEKNRGKN